MRDLVDRPAASKAVAAVGACVALALIGWWLRLEPGVELAISLPGRDGRPAVALTAEVVTDLSGTFASFGVEARDLPGHWPRFRGADFDNIVKSGVSLDAAWGDDGPRSLWSVELGEGHAAPVVQHGRVYLIDYDEATRSDAIRCLSLADGREIWRRSYAVTIKRNHGLSRTVPAVTDRYLVTMGPRCHVVCLDPATGDFRWGIDLQKDYGATEPLWYTGQCPLIDDGAVVLAPGGPDALLMAVDGGTGQVIWQTPNPNGWTMSHSSIMPMTIAGTRMYVYCALGGVVGVAADGGRAGEVLWELPWNARVVAPSPVAAGDDRIFLTAGYGNGSRMVVVHRDGDAFTPEVLFERSPREGLACEQQTPILYEGLLYGIMPKDAGALKGQFVCYRTDGTLVWSSGADNRFGLGPFALADGRFYVLSDDGVLTMLEASREAFVLLDRARVLDGHDAWGPIATAGGRMLLRDSRRMVCLAVGDLQ